MPPEADLPTHPAEPELPEPEELEHPKPVESDPDHDPLALLKALAEASAVFIVFTFIGGWSYLASYYKAFGLNPLELDIPVPVVCTTAIYVLFDAKWPFIIVTIVVLGIVSLSLMHRKLPRSVGAAMLGLLLLTVSTAGITRGKQDAADDVITDSSALPFVAFATKLPKTDQPSCVDYQTYGSSDCKLLLHANRTYYFFQPIPDVGQGNLNVFTLADVDVGGIHILRGLDRNARTK